MTTNEISLTNQLTSASQNIAECEVLRTELQRLQTHMETVVAERDQTLESLQQSALTNMQAERQRIHDNADRELDTLRLDCNSRRETLQQNLKTTLHRLVADLEVETNNLEERRKSELWVLQSVMDEDGDDSPVVHFEREAETFVTQKAFLDERFEILQQQLKDSEQYLANSHATTEAELPPPNLNVTKRLELKDAAVEAGNQAMAAADEIERLKLPRWLQGFRIWALSLLAFVVLWIPIVAARADLRQFINPELTKPDWQWTAMAALIAAVIVVMFAVLSLVSAQASLRSRFQSMLQHVSNARAARAGWEQKSQRYVDRMEGQASEWRLEVEQRRIQQTQKLTEDIDSRIASLRNQTATQQAAFEGEIQRQVQQIDHELTTAEQRIEARKVTDVQQALDRTNIELQTARDVCEQQAQRTMARERLAEAELIATWRSIIDDLRAVAKESSVLAAATRRWPKAGTGQWTLPTEMPTHLSVGDLLTTVPNIPDALPRPEPSNLCLEMPAILRFPTDTSLLVEHDSAGRDTALSFIRTQLLRLLTVIPAGRIRLTLIDPVGLGQSFSATMHLADFDELLIHSRIWTDSTQIRDQLQKVTVHMENIFQTYLRSQFDTIEEYNASAGEVAEPYHFAVVAGFPTAFTDESARHLSSILTSGPRCGVHAIVAWNPTIGVPPSFDVDDLTNNCVRFKVDGDVVLPQQEYSKAVLFEQYPEPAAETYVQLVRDVGEQSRDARRVEVSFNRIAPRDDEIWSHSTADGIDFPIGRAGAARLQFMRLGRGTSQHALVAGKTGSGKSTLLHILITNLALHYSPNEIQFYLIDFKKGVEFRTYAAHKLPHARVIAIESDREFGLSVLERLDEVLQERGELFRERGVQDVPSFRKQFPIEPMPRLLLLIDEFQEFFVAEDRVSARASLLLDRLVRQGRAFGIHVLLGSQTLGGAYSLARSTMGQIAVRIALQCSESDAHLILSEDNPAARMLTRPGEAIYNDANGLRQGNHQFQIAWLDEERREQAIATMVARPTDANSAEQGMIVFEGNVPPTPELCRPLNIYLKATDDATRRTTDCITIWLGQPVAIAAPTCVDIRRASGQNLLLVGQDESQADGLIAYTILSTCRPFAADAKTAAPKLTLLHDGRDADSLQRFQSLRTTLPETSFEIGDANAADALIKQHYDEIVLREDNAERATAAEQILVVRNVGQFRSLRKDDDDFGLGGFGEPKEATTASMFSDILKRGPLVGIHVVVWSDTFSNVVRWLSSSLLREFENRIAFRMNQTDSASLIDSPVAASLGPARAIIYRDQTGATEKFRPFAWPSNEWLNSLTGEPPADVTTDFDIDSLTIE